MKEPFDYSIVPYTFGLCAAEECPRATTCLRPVSYTHLGSSLWGFTLLLFIFLRIDAGRGRRL